MDPICEAYAEFSCLWRHTHGAHSYRYVKCQTIDFCSSLNSTTRGMKSEILYTSGFFVYFCETYGEIAQW